MVTPTSTGGPVNRKFMPHHENQIKFVVCALGLPTYAPLEGARDFRAGFRGRGTINMNILVLVGAFLVSLVIYIRNAYILTSNSAIKFQKQLELHRLGLRNFQSVAIKYHLDLG